MAGQIKLAYYITERSRCRCDECNFDHNDLYRLYYEILLLLGFLSDNRVIKLQWFNSVFSEQILNIYYKSNEV